MPKPPRSTVKRVPMKRMDTKALIVPVRASNDGAEGTEEGSHLVQVSNFAERLLIGESNSLLLVKLMLILHKLLCADSLDSKAQTYDVIFTFPGDKSLKSNSKFLKSNSRYFKLMLNSGFKESSITRIDGCREIKIMDHSYEIYRATLVYLLTTRITFDSIIRPPLIYALAHQLELERLKNLAIINYGIVYLNQSNLLAELVSELVETYSDLKEVVMLRASAQWESLCGTKAMESIKNDLKEGELSRGGIDNLFECISLAGKRSDAAIEAMVAERVELDTQMNMFR